MSISFPFKVSGLDSPLLFVPLEFFALSWFSRCLFNLTMRIPKLAVASCPSFFATDFPAPFSSRFLRFFTGFLPKIESYPRRWC
ncbi:hypothetical protein V6N12_071150 [Hibiscus sabdariffa]|uniref:Uncharacterized protein n=1 Tax=Hibiscus sabdariffa TaxID=183260 RepID=A0ABR2FIX0_9ROSI